MRFLSLFPTLAALAAALLVAAGVSCREETQAAAAPAGTQATGTTYVMEMKGMVCGGCMMEVKDALARLDGVPDEAVAFKRGSRPETRKVVFVAKNPSLTKEQVAEALGEARERLVIEDFVAGLEASP